MTGDGGRRSLTTRRGFVVGLGSTTFGLAGLWKALGYLTGGHSHSHSSGEVSREAFRRRGRSTSIGTAGTASSRPGGFDHVQWSYGEDAPMVLAGFVTMGVLLLGWAASCSWRRPPSPTPGSVRAPDRCFGKDN